LPKGPFAMIALLSALAGAAQAQTADSPANLIARWTASDATCRNAATPAADAIGACEQRDALSKLLALARYCAGQKAWMPCAATQRNASPSATAPFQRMGGVFVLSALLNGSGPVYFIVDSGAATVQIPEEAAEELRRNGTLTEADFMGQHQFILADGRRMQQRVFRLRTLQLGERTMENVLATVGARQSRALLGQSFLRRLSWWKIDNVNNAMEFEFTGAF
jgi:aspartyl protease family protein